MKMNLTADLSICLWDKHGKERSEIYITYKKQWSFPSWQVSGKADILLLMAILVENKKVLPGTILQPHPVTCVCVRVNVIYLQVKHKVMETFLRDAVVESY